MCHGTLPKVQDGSGDPTEGPEWVGEPPRCQERVGRYSWRFGTGQGTVPGVWDAWRCPSEDSRWAGRSFGRSGMGRVTLPVVRHGWGGPPEGPERVDWTSRRSGTGWWTLPEVQTGTLPKV